MDIYSYDNWQLQDMWATMEIIDEWSPHIEYARVYVNIPYNLSTVMPRFYILLSY